jgi:hypothetical protein
MENDLKYNLFEFASSELSHSALWAWIIRSVDSQSYRYELPKKIARSFLRDFVGTSFDMGTPFIVKREYYPPGDNKAVIDIFVSYESNGRLSAIVIENKLKDVIDCGQIDKIHTSFDNTDNVTYLLLNTGYDFMVKGLCGDIKDTVRILERFKDWTIIGIERILSLLNRFVDEMNNSVIIADYYDWLKYKYTYYRELEDNAFSADDKDVEYALSKPEGQWFFMKSIFSGINGIQYNGNNIGGAPWTQFRFFQLSKEDPEYERFRCSIFYRIDRTKREGYYLRLNTYYGDGILEHEKPTLDELRRHYRNLMSPIPLESKTVDGYNEKENVIGAIVIEDNSPNEIKTQIPYFHGEFKRILINKGWPERGFLDFFRR